MKKAFNVILFLIFICFCLLLQSSSFLVSEMISPTVDPVTFYNILIKGFSDLLNDSLCKELLLNEFTKVEEYKALYSSLCTRNPSNSFYSFFNCIRPQVSSNSYGLVIYPFELYDWWITYNNNMLFNESVLRENLAKLFVARLTEGGLNQDFICLLQQLSKDHLDIQTNETFIKIIDNFIIERSQDGNK